MIKCGKFVVIEEVLGKIKTGPNGPYEPTKVLDISYHTYDEMKYVESQDIIYKFFDEGKIKFSSSEEKKTIRIIVLKFEDDNSDKIYFSKETKEKLKQRFKFESKKEAKDELKKLLHFIRENVSLTKDEIEDTINKMGTGKTGLIPYSIYTFGVMTDRNKIAKFGESDNYWFDSKKYI